MTLTGDEPTPPNAAGAGLPIAPLAESGLLAQLGDRIDEELVGRVLALADAIDAAALPGVVDVVPSYTTLMVVFDPERTDGEAVAAAIRRLAVATPAQPPPGRARAIPVAYGGDLGPDLEAVAAHAGLTPDEVVRRHSAARYRVACMGFAPGFGYLLGLPPELAMPRRATPRVRVPAGSVALGGAQAAVYPLTTPGGWHVLGRTPTRMFDLAASEPIFLQPGDEVRFEPIDRATYDRLASELAERPVLLPPPPGAPAIEVVKPGLLDSVQDLGRPGRMRAGITPGGACDRAALTLGNRLVGNPPDAAAIESTLAGPTLRFHGDAVVALTGADAGARLNGQPAPCWEPFAVRDGDELALGAMRDGARTYVCVAGGIDVPVVLGGRGTDLFGRFGGWQGRAFAAGDRLPLGLPAAPADDLLRRRLVAMPPHHDAAAPIRIVLGPQRDRFTDEGVAALLEAPYAVTPQSDRVGLRLRGPAIGHRDGADLISEGIAAGAIQAPGDGQPIVLLPARQTIGGYPKIATVVGADLDRLGQARPGDALRFAAVDVAEARLALLAARAALGPEAVTERARPVPGWSPAASAEAEPEPSPADAATAWTPAGVADLIERARRSEAASLDLEIAAIGMRLRVRWDAGPPGEAAPPRGPAAAPEAAIEAEEDIIAAPVLGIFYRRSEPGAPPLAEAGQTVRAGQPIAVLEVMKTYHEVAAPRDGTLTAFLVEDGAFVEYGQPLARMAKGGKGVGREA